MIIGKLCFGKDDFAYGLELSLHKAGRKAYSVNEKTVRGCDVLLVTVFWFMDAYALRLFFEKARISKADKTRPLIIIGGMQATMTPKVFAPFADYVFVGDADDHLGPILDAVEAGNAPESPHLYTEGMDALPVPAECAPSAFAMSKGGKRDVTRIEIARGCKYKCPFCVLSNMKPYREVAFDEIRPMLDKIRKGAVSLFAPERTMHSEWARFAGYVQDRGLRDLGQDARLERLLEIKSRAVTCGIEGISERLRKSIRKPFTDDFICEQFSRFIEQAGGVVMLSAYFIADLPGETEEDWTELYRLFERIEKADWSRKLTFKPVLNPLSPKNFTKMADATIHPFRDYERRWIDLLRKGGSGQWGFRLVETLVWGPWERMLDVVVNTGDEYAAAIINRIPSKLLKTKPNKALREQYARKLLQLCEEQGLTQQKMRIEA